MQCGVVALWLFSSDELYSPASVFFVLNRSWITEKFVCVTLFTLNLCFLHYVRKIPTMYGQLFNFIRNIVFV